MEAMTELFSGLGFGCQGLQWQAYTRLQLLLDNLAPGPDARWAAGHVRSCDAAGGAAPSHRHALSFFGPLKTTSVSAWAGRGARLASNTGCHSQQHCRAACSASFAGRLASLSVSGGPAATTAISIAAEPERRSCCSASAGNQEQQQQHGGATKQQTVVIQQQKGGEEQPQYDPWNQLRRMSGTWIRNRDSSDSMEDAMNLMRLNGIVRQAVKLVRGVRIELDPDTFTFTVFSVISWFKVKEMYPLSGEERQYRRRDLRRGGALGHVEPYGQDVQVQLRWNDPLGGRGADHFRLISEDELHIESVIEVGGQTARYLTIYNRKPDRGHRHDDGAHADGHDHGQGRHHHHQQQQGQGQEGRRYLDAHLASASTELGEVDTDDVVGHGGGGAGKHERRVGGGDRGRAH